MRSRIAAALLLSLALLASGCHHTVVRAGPRAPGHTESRVGWNLFWGLTDADIDLPDCPNGLSYAEVWYPWWAFFPEAVTFGILSPKRLVYACAMPPVPMAPVPVPVPVPVH